MEKDLKHIAFVIYCVEAYKARKGTGGKDTYNLLKAADAVRFIDENYDALHTFGDAEIVRNIDEYLKNKGANIFALPVNNAQNCPF
jgi:hypothetical protein